MNGHTNGMEREYGKRQFKGNSPLATSKGSTAVAAEGLISSLRKKYSKSFNKNGLLNEESLIEDENI